ncbi:PspC domain-containing protein [Nonomuraea sp. NEAU-A123]|uniref:PspC domain-containing protein n=1 Tax=Nonomuraea sp. NEAU-A123 TaxID=2839649 RepID=UPI001BE46F87|nr:PspC domain-containing protein [Nonomuraea sp. NEAU-A123]MBT2224402.1 PspC domain-containing protein [Nonomuraea sp. NEAU-A123]
MTEAPPKRPAAPPSALRRSSEGRFLMGVCAGLGRHTGIDPVVFRVGFTVLLFGSGVGLFLYIAAFLLMKEPNGRPGYIEQWTRRDFAADTVMALLAAVLAAGLGINLASVWLGTGTLVVGMMLAIGLLAAHTSGVDLLGLVRSMPERLNRRPPQGEPDPFLYDFAHSPIPSPTAPTAGFPRSRPADSYAREPVTEPAPPVGPEPPTAPTRVNPVAADAPLDEPATARAEPYPEPTQEPTRDSSQEAPFQRPAGETPPPAAPRFRAEPKTAVAYGEPFAPRGPYQPLDPSRRPGGYSPYDPALYGRPTPPSPPRRKRPRSFIGAITMLLAIIIGGIVVAVQARSASGVSPTLVGGAVLVTIGAGLLIAAWWGRGAGLVAIGTMVALLIGLGLMLGDLPRNVGDFVWRPTTVAEASKLYDVGVGDGRLDLSELKLTPGTSLTFNAKVSIGELTVIVPPTARVEVHASNKVGDIKVDQSLRGGVDVKFDKVLEPDTRPKGAVSTIVLNLRGGVGDMEVRRAA